MIKLPLAMSSLLVLAHVAMGQPNYPYVITTLAGSNPMGDGGPAVSALIDNPGAVAVDAKGNVFVTDEGNNCIRVVTPAGTITTYASSIYAYDLAVDPAGNLYVGGYSSIVKISPTGVTTTVAGGSYGFGGDEQPATSAKLTYAVGLALDSNGNLYFLDANNYRIRKITKDGIIHTVAGNGTGNSSSGDNGPATSASLYAPSYIAVDSGGNLYISERYRVRRVDPTGTITTFAGNGNCCYGGDGGPATNATLAYGDPLAVDSSGNLYLGENGRIRMISASGMIRLFAGTGTAGFGGDGGLASSARISSPAGMAFDAAGNLYFADQSNQRVRKIAISGLISTVAGRTHFGGDNGPATSAILHWPEHAIVDRLGNLYISDTDNNRIRKVSVDGKITTIAGDGTCAFSGDTGPAKSARLCHPEGMALDAAGNLYFADSGYGKIRQIDGNGTITSIPETQACGTSPFGVAVDSAGVVYFSDQYAYKVCKVLPSGTVVTIAPELCTPPKSVLAG